MKRIERIFRIAEIVLHTILVILCAMISLVTTNIIVSIAFTIITFMAGSINLIEILDYLTERRKK